ncbi:MAG TPA: glycosyltransferase family 9 protein [Methylomirabilota bacterium]|jgi:ADP-heptose:LPS heptosyltransferase
MKAVLVLRALGLGDFLTALPALRALGTALPAHRRLLAMPAALAPLARIAGVADEIIDARPLAPLPPLAAPPAVAVNLHGRGPQSHRVLLATRPRRLVAFAHPDVPETAGAPVFRERDHTVQRWCHLLEAYGIAADATRLELLPPGGRLPAAPPAIACGATLIHAGAASGARRWPAERFAAVARAERGAGRRVILTGGADERPLALSIAHAAGLDEAAVFAGRTSVVELTALVAVAGRVVCGDTGVAHLATALRTPSVVLFGPISPALWGPPVDRPWHRALWAGRTGDPHAARLDAGLSMIGVADVLAALEGVVEAAA